MKVRTAENGFGLVICLFLFSQQCVVLAQTVPGSSSEDVNEESAETTNGASPEARVVANSRYAAGSFRRFFLGNGYRDLWTAPISVPILDLSTYAGGLTPNRAHIGRQTTSLRLLGADGREYLFRSVDKDPRTVLPEDLRVSLYGKLIKDAVSSTHPYGNILVAFLLRVADILHVSPVIMVMPDDPALGEYRDQFAGMLGLLEVRADENQDLEHAFAGAIKVTGSEKLFQRINKSPAHRINGEKFLKARLLDLFIGDRDRHRSNWRWAKMSEPANENDPVIWEPISRDHDHAFEDIRGLIPLIASNYSPGILEYGPEYPAMYRLTWNGQEVDRRFFSFETDEIRVRMFGGADHVAVRGRGNPDITVRIMAGKGKYILTDSTAGQNVRLHFYDQPGGEPYTRGRTREVNRKSYDEWVGSNLDRYPPREWDALRSFVASISLDSDFGLIVDGGFVRDRYGFRKEPYAHRTIFRVGVSSSPARLRFAFSTQFQLENSERSIKLSALASGLEMLHYYGQGNDTSSNRGTTDFFDVRHRRFQIDLRYLAPFSGTFTAEIGPTLVYSNTERKDNRLISLPDTTIYEADGFGQVGIRFSVVQDTRNQVNAATSGYLIDSEIRVFPAVWSVSSSFTSAHVIASTYFSRPLPLQPTVAVRIGAKKNMGNVSVSGIGIHRRKQFASRMASREVCRRYRALWKS